jgi:lipopolysaccharide export system permease protein
MNAGLGVATRYVAHRVSWAVLGAWAVLAGFNAIVGLADDIGRMDEGGSLSQAVLGLVLTLPRRLYETFPTAAVIGSLLGLGGLAASAELTALRSLGLSRWRIGLAGLLGIGALTVLMMLTIETVVPFSERQADQLGASSGSESLQMGRLSGLWAREGRIFLNARAGSRQEVDGEGVIELRGVRLYEFDEAGRLQSLAEARAAEWRQGQWLLREVRRTRLDAASARVETAAQERWESQLDADALASTLAKPRHLSSAELLRNIEYLQRNELRASEFQNAFWARWMYPLQVLALVLATLPFAFGSLRSGGFGKRLFFGVAFGLGFLILQRMFVSLADVYRFHPLFAHLLPSLLLLGVGAWVARRDGGR